MSFFSSLFGPPSKDKFAKLVLKTFADLGVPVHFKYSKEDFSLVSSDGEVFNLHNFYAEYCRMNRSDRQQALQRWAMVQFETIAGIPENLEEALPNLRPKLWMKWSLEQLRLHQQMKGEEWSSSPVISVGKHCCLALVYDLPNAISTIAPDQFAKWGISFHDAMKAAVENLAQATQGYAKIGDGFYIFMNGDNYDASRLVLAERLQQFEVKGELIVAAPNRDSLLITGSEDHDGLMIMFDLIQKAMAEPRPMSPIPMRLVGDQWFDWEIPSSLPCYNQWREMQVQFLGEIYNEQKQLLEAIHEKDQVDVFVASFSGLSNKKTGQLMSFSVWGEGIPTLLPRTDTVFVGRQDSSGFLVPWEQVEDIVGDLIEPTDKYPPRYSVTEFPTPEQMGRLESFALDND